MDYIIKKPENKHVIILVHGLNGSADSWRGGEQRFVENLTKENLIQENFDIALFTYQTKIFTVNWIKKKINLIKGFVYNRPHEDIKGFNVGIDAISRNLETEIRNISKRYKTISIIAHSMGGLVSKSALVWMSDEEREKIQLFISLSVPHIGSQLAATGSVLSVLLGRNPQIIDLKAMGDFTTQLNERYSNLAFRPKVIYQHGNQDTVVLRQAAIPPNVHINDTISTSDDHFSVLLIKDRNNNLVLEKIIEELGFVLQPFYVIDISVPNGTTFRFLVETFAAKSNIKVNFKGFSETDLNTTLREGKITSHTVEDTFYRAADLTINSFPAFKIEKEIHNNHYTLTKTI